MIGQLADERSATTFSDYLVVQGIENEIEVASDGSWLVWIMEEELIARAVDLLAAYKAAPDDPRFQGHSRAARQIEEREQQEAAESGKRVLRREDIIASHGPFGMGPLCGVLLFFCAAVFMLTGQGDNPEAIRSFFIGSAELEGGPMLGEIRQGEVWRLVTPIFLHFGWVHLLCNALWIFSLGSLIEARRGTRFLLLFVLVTAIFPNLGQYLVTGSPRFGGMSGVVFALAGYAWQRGRHDPGSGIGLDPRTVLMLFVYFVLCWAQELNPPGVRAMFGTGARVANTVHTVGLVIGAVWGWVDARRAGRG